MRRKKSNSPWIQLELDLGLPKPKQPELREGTRVLILPPHEDAGKTGRVNLTPGWLGGAAKERYTVNLRGKSIGTHRNEMQPIGKKVNKLNGY
jgi:hypothetical protein